MMDQGQLPCIRRTPERDADEFVGMLLGVQSLRHDGYAESIGHQVFNGFQRIDLDRRLDVNAALLQLGGNVLANPGTLVEGDVRQ